MALSRTPGPRLWLLLLQLFGKPKIWLVELRAHCRVHGCVGLNLIKLPSLAYSFSFLSAGTLGKGWPICLFGVLGIFLRCSFEFAWCSGINLFLSFPLP